MTQNDILCTWVLRIGYTQGSTRVNHLGEGDKATLGFRGQSPLVGGQGWSLDPEADAFFGAKILIEAFTEHVGLYSVSHIARNLFLTGSSKVAEQQTGSIFEKCTVRGLNFICGDF